MNRKLRLCPLLIVLAFPPLARAELSGSLALTSDYVFRGLTQSNRDPAVQAGIEWASGGLHVGAWGSSISWLSDLSSVGTPVSSSVELDFYAGFGGEFSETVNWDVGVYHYYYPGDYPTGFTRPYTTELYAGLGFGDFALKYSHAVTNLFGFDDSDGSGYLEASFDRGFADNWTLNLHAGHQRIDIDGDFDYTDWKIGVTRAFGSGFEFALAYVDTNAGEDLYTNAFGEYVGDATLLVSIGKSF